MAETGSQERDSIEVVREKIRSLCDSVSEAKEGIKDLERRTRGLENYVSNFKTAHDDRQEKLKMVLNFLVQLIWVVIASYILTKLGIGMGPA